MHYIWYSAKHTHVYWSPIRNIFSCIQRKVLRKLIVVCLGTIHVWRGPLGRRIPIRSLGMSHSLWPHLACARVPENHLIIWFWKSHFISLKFCILVDVEQMFWLILVRLSKQSATPQTNRNVHEIVNQIFGCGRIWTSNEQVISTNI